MALTNQPILGRIYRVTAPEFIPCFPSRVAKQLTGTEIERGYFVRFLAAPENDLWEVEYYDPNKPSFELRRAYVGAWAWSWLLPVFQKRR